MASVELHTHARVRLRLRLPPKSDWDPDLRCVFLPVALAVPLSPLFAFFFFFSVVVKYSSILVTQIFFRGLAH
jgi:hypothetical protein